MFERQKFIWLAIAGLLLSLCFACRLEVSEGLNSPPPKPQTTVFAPEIYLPPRKDFRLAIISDLNSQYGSTEYEPEVKQAIALMPQWQPDLVLCGGDMIAGQKVTLSKSQIESMWTAFDRHIAAPLRRYNLPFGFTIGNHDGSGAIKNQSLIFKQERDLAQTYWHEHQDRLGLDFVEAENFPFDYSFQQNGIFFLVWDASTQNISEAQLTWVKQALNSEIAQQSKAKIVIGHLPLYPVAVAKNKPGEYLAQGEKLRSLLEQNQVRIYISGHHHAYYPGKKGDLELLHAGALGQGARQLINSNMPPHPTITIADLEIATSQITYTTYNATTWNLISIEELPASIPVENGSILRHDLSK
ncbi:MAG: metallophosphoesterase [Pleurocapsa sp. MO_226.B13]|nr:metallophosphoesterase [Pleurocapsa sp. MO_226.B13]